MLKNGKYHKIVTFQVSTTRIKVAEPTVGEYFTSIKYTRSVTKLCKISYLRNQFLNLISSSYPLLNMAEEEATSHYITCCCRKFWSQDCVEIVLLGIFSYETAIILYKTLPKFSITIPTEYSWNSTCSSSSRLVSVKRSLLSCVAVLLDKSWAHYKCM